METNHHTSFFVVIIGAFFFFSGIYSIVISLINLGQHKSDSTIETKLFKFNAPVGITYGIAALLVVVGIVKLDKQEAQDDEMQKLKNKNVDLAIKNHRLMTSDSAVSQGVIQETFSFFNPQSIFNGKVLVQAESGGFTGDPSLKFTGIIGVSPLQKGPFDTLNIETAKGKRFYFMTNDSIVWGVNTIDDVGNLTLEIYKDNLKLKTNKKPVLSDSIK
ncbi:hypothetical protein HHL22_09880 [Hymenobacter sp. RP-2-7]|uniref:Uncharacterized protein n=1 Tax=Hymenobacter polaris TaxID=2682546 RepID=A0A7Y0ADW5_9BACT|nr:hypothetical protein [Hymenobacter polaris]NML65512.1 hypothetical protein [Hymenobacter polaris]